MKTKLLATLETTMSEWLEKQDSHDDRPPGLACENLAAMMAAAAAAAYDASHAGAVAANSSFSAK